tara:strand:- start:497 stop:1660 length:1164 start_codon:yes stop_codon:yes gene_type:complete
MKKKIVILGSTGSIGKTTINLFKDNLKNYEIVLLTTNNNIKQLMKQVKTYKVKNVIISDYDKFIKFKKNFKNKKVNVYNNFNSINKILRKKVDYTMCSISGIDGLKPTLNVIPLSKKIAIANKESIVCGWNLIKKKLKLHKTEFVPVDSEHFSIWSLVKNIDKEKIDKVYITASGGPFLNWSKKKVSKAKAVTALKHPNWSMGKKISIDSASLMNKVFEVIEAQRIFELDISKFEILIHEKSYVHAIVKFKNGLTKLLIHDTKMDIPIFNTINFSPNVKISNKQINFNLLNNLNFNKVNRKKFPNINILKHITNKISLFETVLISANDELVDMYLDNKIKFNEISSYLYKIINLKEFTKYKKKTPKNVNEIDILSRYVRLKTQTLCI